MLIMAPQATVTCYVATRRSGVPFFYASGSEFEEMYVGVGARRVRVCLMR